MKIQLDGVELIVKQVKDSVSVSRVVARDRRRGIDITSGVKFSFRHHEDEEAVKLLRVMKQVVSHKTAPCTCDYRYGYSDHAEHCQSIYVAREFRGETD